MVRTAAVIVGLGVAAKALGMLRDAASAAAFGATRSTDVFFLVFNIWLTLCVVLATSLNYVLVPAFVRRGHNEGAEAARVFMWSTALVGVVLGAAVVIGLETGAATLIRGLGRGLSTDEMALGVELVRITAVVLPATVLCGILGAFLRSLERYYWAETPLLLLNLGSVVGVLVFATTQGVSALAWGMTAGAILAAITLFLASSRVAGRPRAAASHFGESTRLIGSAAVMTLLGHSGGYLANVVENVFTIRMPAGQLSCLTYGRRLLYLPHQVVTPAVLTPGLTTLSRAAYVGAEDANAAAVLMFRRLTWTLMPLIAGSALLAPELVRVAYGRGEFSDEASRITTFVIFALVPIPLISLARNVLANRLFASGYARLPLIAGVLGLVCFSTAAAMTWRRFGLWSVIGSQILADAVAASFLYHQAYRRTQLSVRPLRAFVAKSFVSLSAAIVVGATCLYALGLAVQPSSTFGAGLRAIVVGPVILGVYWSCSRWIGIEEAVWALRSFLQLIPVGRDRGSAG